MVNWKIVSSAWVVRKSNKNWNTTLTEWHVPLLRMTSLATECGSSFHTTDGTVWHRQPQSYSSPKSWFARVRCLRRCRRHRWSWTCEKHVPNPTKSYRDPTSKHDAWCFLRECARNEPSWRRAAKTNKPEMVKNKISWNSIVNDCIDWTRTMWTGAWAVLNHRPRLFQNFVSSFNDQLTRMNGFWRLRFIMSIDGQWSVQSNPIRLLKWSAEPNKLTLVMADGRPNSNFLFLRHVFCFPPVFLRLWKPLWTIPENEQDKKKVN